MKKTQAVVYTGLMAAVLSALSVLQIPMPSGVPITLQTFAVALCGYVLGCRAGTAATAVYLLLGLVGVPVYAGFTSGPGILFGMTGGFIFGFVVMAFFCGTGITLHGRTAGLPRQILQGLLGLCACHLLGILQFAFTTGVSFGQSFLLCSLPYIIKDVISVVGACFAAAAVRRALLKAGLLQTQQEGAETAKA
ncbi:MAG: biotin transporter BioY [Lachnospiraceae bacterium]|jgi:biotin transport system substrate-specific component|nr:biotin transporter BioY [Lachnospiraceae bacterium]